VRSTFCTKLKRLVRGLRQQGVVDPLVEERDAQAAAGPDALGGKFAGQRPLRSQVRVGDGQLHAGGDRLVEFGDRREPVGDAQ
jgi:hypothetical protein